MPFEHATPTETRIAKCLVVAALARDWAISVNDGEDVTVAKSTKKAEIFDAMNSTDHDYLIFHDAEDKWIGWVQLIWGNDEDLISDASDNEHLDSLLEGF